MNHEPLYRGDYADRQVEAAHRVLVDVAQVLGSFGDAIVLVGGWVPDLIVPAPQTQHVGSIDVDLALDAQKLADGRYAELLKLLFDTGRYERGGKTFQLVTTVDLNDGEPPVKVDVEFLAPTDVKMKKNRPKLVDDFRVLLVPACAAALRRPETIEFEGLMISGASNTVHLQVASLPDFIVMKAHAVNGRDTPKDVYDICFCLDEFPNAIQVVADDWRSRPEDALVVQAIRILREKFPSVDHYGPRQLAVFHDSSDRDERAMQSRRAFELVQKLLSLL
jgi:hypothetical protein